MTRLLAALACLALATAALAQVPAVVPPPKSAEEFWPWLLAGLVGIYLQPLTALVRPPSAAKACAFDPKHPPQLEEVHGVLHWRDSEGAVRPMLSGERRRKEDADAESQRKLLEEIRDEQRAIRPELTACFRVMTRLAKRFGDAEDRNEEAVRILERETT